MGPATRLAKAGLVLISTGGDVGRPAPYPSPFYQSLSSPTSPEFYQQAQCVFRPHVFQANPPSTSQSLPNCLSTAPYLLSFTISYFHDFGTSLPYKSFISSRRLQKKQRIFHQRGNVKRNSKKIQSPKEKNICVLKRGNPRSL